MLIQWGSSVGTENFSPVNEAKRQSDAETTGRAEKTLYHSEGEEKSEVCFAHCGHECQGNLGLFIIS